MAQAQAAAAANDEQSTGAARPVKTFKQAGVEVSVWRNNATTRKSY
jgi:hypothetical protein